MPGNTVQRSTCGASGESFIRQSHDGNTNIDSCVFGEMYRKDPWLAGESDRDQLIKIFTHCGPLNENTMPGWRDLDGFPDEPDHPWNQTVAGPTLLEMSTTYGYVHYQE